jgi:hypothetical protein
LTASKQTLLDAQHNYVGEVIFQWNIAAATEGNNSTPISFSIYTQSSKPSTITTLDGDLPLGTPSISDRAQAPSRSFTVASKSVEPSVLQELLVFGGFLLGSLLFVGSLFQSIDAILQKIRSASRAVERIASKTPSRTQQS